MSLLKLSVSNGTGVTNSYRAIGISFEGLLAAIRKPENHSAADKMGSRSLIACHLEGNDRSKGKGVLPGNALIIDADATDLTMAERVTAVEEAGLACVWWHSASSSDEMEKGRFVFELSRDVTADEYARLMPAVMAHLGWTDKATLPQKQFYFLPTAASYKRGTGMTQGAAIDVDALMPAVEAPAERVAPAAREGNAAELQAALNAIPCEELDYQEWVSVGMALAYELGDDGEELFQDWSAQDAARYDEEQTHTHWESFSEQGTGKVITGGTLFHIAERYGYSRFAAASDEEFAEAFTIADPNKGRVAMLFDQWASLPPDQVRIKVMDAMVISQSAVERAQLAKQGAPIIGCTAKALEDDRKAILRARRMEAATYPDLTDDGMALPSAINASHFADTVLESLCFDEFGQVVLYEGRVISRNEGPDRIEMQLTAEQTGLRGVQDNRLWDAIEAAAMRNRFDSLTAEWEMLEAWDGVPRLGTLMSRYFGAEQSEYSDAVGRYLMTAMAARAMNPGAKADMAVILAGAQGFRKSSIVQALSGNSPERFGELAKKHIQNNDELARFIKRKVAVEYAEMRGMRTADQDDIKSLMTRQYDEERPMRKDDTRQHPRRGVMIGTYNPDAYKGGVLTDNTGNRRWLPVDVVRVCDPEGLQTVFDQVRAEALAMWRESGVAWQDAERLAVDQHEAHMAKSAWEDQVVDFLAGCPGFVSLADTLEHFGVKANAFAFREIKKEVERQGWAQVKDTRHGPWRHKVLFCSGGALPPLPDETDEF